jgi:hypothetical protein
MRFVFLIILLASAVLAFAQDTGRKRTRTIDYTQYDQLTSSLGYAPDKLKAAKRLLEVSDALFTPEDEEYFTTRKLVAIYFEQAYDNTRALELIQQGIDAYEKNFPFYTRGYATTTEDYALYTFLDFFKEIDPR